MELINFKNKFGCLVLSNQTQNASNTYLARNKTFLFNILFLLDILSSRNDIKIFLMSGGKGDLYLTVNSALIIHLKLIIVIFVQPVCVSLRRLEALFNATNVNIGVNTS